MKTLRLPVPGGIATAVVGAVGMLVCWAGAVQGQDTLDVDVVFYDFHSDRSNPEFEQPHGKYDNSSQKARPNMVQTMLDEDGKPMANGASAYLNQGIRFWFRDWSKLEDASTYKMVGKADAEAPAGKTYLSMFRPIYTYNNGTLPPNVRSAAPNGVSEFDASSITFRKKAYGPSDFSFTDNYGSVNLTTNNSIDTAYKNKVIPAVLTFRRVAGSSSGVYEFIKSEKGVNGFFPLTGQNGTLYDVNYGNSTLSKGAVRFNPTNRPTRLEDDNWSSQGIKSYNVSFTMEMKCKFRMEPGLTFKFEGDDDVWLFINNRLVPTVDLGGIHEAVPGEVRLENITATHGLVNDGIYDFNFFYAERHSDDSNIKITTNILGNRFTGLVIKVDGDTMTAGVPKLATAEVHTDLGDVVKDFSAGTFTWTARDLGGYNNPINPASAIGKPVNKSDSVTVTVQKAYTTIRIVGQYCGTSTEGCVRDSVDVWVKPGPVSQVSVEASGDSLTSLRAVAKLDTVKIMSSATADSNFYAILRDQYGNWISRAATGTATTTGRTIAWATTSTAIATAATNDATRGRGKATRVANEGSTPLTVTYFIPGAGAGTGTFTGNSVVKLENVTYKAIQVGIKQGNTFVPLSSSTDPNNPGTVRMVVGNDTTLYVKAQRSDNNAWEEIPASWLVGGLTTESPAPSGSSVSWNMKPTTATPVSAPGTVTVSLSGVSAKLNVVVEFRDPVAARFFNRSGEPIFDSSITRVQDMPTNRARMYVVPTWNVELIAGKSMPIVGQLFTSTTVNASTWLSNATSGKWTWAPVPGSPSITKGGEGISENPTLRGGDSITFMTTVAHNTYQIRGTYVDATRNITITQDIWIRVIPDTYNPVLVIEPNNQGLTLSPNAPQKVSELIFTEGDQQKVVYAVIRDKYGNYICPSGAPNPYPPPAGSGTTDWTTSKNIITLEPGSALWGEVRINRGEHADGQEAVVTAKNTAWGNVSDNVNVIFRGYDYDEIQIVKVCDGNGGSQLFAQSGVSYCDVGDELRMNSNEDKPIYVFGKRNDCEDVKPGSGVSGGDCWESIAGDWSRDPSLVVALSSPPSGVPSWTLSPEGTGSGEIIVRRPGTDMADTINVVITVGPPTRTELVILTPADQLIAGKEISAIVNYYNRAGLMTEWDPSWNNNPQGSLFADTLGLGTADKWIPKVISQTTQDLCYQGSGCLPTYINAALAHSVTNLSDNVKFIIYYAADGHQIRYNETITVDGKAWPLTAASPKFTVLPGEPAGLTIEGANVKNDSLKVSQGDPEQILHAVAVDEYGNQIGDYPSDWSAQTPIPVDVKERPIIVYVPGTAEDNGVGQLCVTAKNGTLKDCITIVLTGVTARPVSAITRDDDGCGYLDKIVMKFKKPIPFAGGDLVTKVKPSTDKIAVQYKDTKLTIDSVTVKTGDSTVTIWLNDVAPHTGATQTGWLPVINIYNGFFDEAGAQTVNTTDGAPPVIATAKLYFPKESSGKVAENYIEVTFSEKVKSSDGAPFGINKNEPNTKFTPELLFNIWGKGGQNAAKAAKTRALSKKAGDQYDKSLYSVQADRLVGITKTIYMDESTLRFYLENEKEISPPNDYINIRTQDAAPDRNPSPGLTPVRDVPDNVPLANNRLVPITFGNEPGGNMRAIPNPASPDPTRRNSNGDYVREGVIYATHDATAVTDIKVGGKGGTVFEVPIYVPSTPGSTVKCQLKVYDLAGNLVISGESDNAASGMEDGYNKMHLYWNGYNSKKMKVAPGTYRMVVYISYNNISKNDANAKSKKYQGLVGMSK